MHSGLFELNELLVLYNAGMPRTPTANSPPTANSTPTASTTDSARVRDNPETSAPGKPLPVKSPLLKPLGLNSEDLDDLATFLESLAEPRLRIRPPDLPPSEPENSLTVQKKAVREGG
jgi:cytochrome c peroxidase